MLPRRNRVLRQAWPGERDHTPESVSTHADADADAVDWAIHHLDQEEQRLLAVERALELPEGQMVVAAACWSSRICRSSPEDACPAIWQCKSQAPGLSAGKAIVADPPPGTVKTSRRGTNGPQGSIEPSE
jgi:hypothetical protein